MAKYGYKGVAVDVVTRKWAQILLNLEGRGYLINMPRI